MPCPARVPSAVWLISLIIATAILAFPQPTRATEFLERPDLDATIKKYAVAGTFVLFEPDRDRFTLVNRQRAETRYIPASTFKVANSLIALETGVVASVDEIIPYGGKPQPFPDWQHDMPMREAIRLSAVPIYQELARRIGLEAYRTWLQRLGYGNQIPGNFVDRFWLDGPLQISAIEQAEFIAHLARHELPVARYIQDIVQSIILNEHTDDFTLYGKTGWCTECNPQLGWWVGWTVKNKRIFAFALNIDIGSVADLPKRLQLGKSLLTTLGAM